jgi:beta-glucosidase-like glycosyl hydrolase
MFEEGLASVMVAHLNVPSLESNQIIPLLFLIMLSQMCFKELGFQGLIFTDALNMKAVSKFSTPGRSIYALSGGERCFIISGRCAFSVRCF